MRGMAGKVSMDRTFQIRQASVEMVPADGLLHLAPNRLHRIQPRRIGWQKMKLETPRMRRQIPLHLGAEVDREVVQHQMKLRLVMLPHGFQKLDEFTAALAVGNPDAALGVGKVDGPKAESLAVLSCRWNPFLDPCWLPVVAEDRLEMQVTFVYKEQMFARMLTGIKRSLQPVNRLFFWV